MCAIKTDKRTKSIFLNEQKISKKLIKKYNKISKNKLMIQRAWQ